MNATLFFNVPDPIKINCGPEQLNMYQGADEFELGQRVTSAESVSVFENQNRKYDYHYTDTW